MVLPGYELLVPPQRRLIEAGAPGPVPDPVHRRQPPSERPPGTEFLKRTPHCLEGSWGARVIDELEPRENDIYVVKRRYSASFRHRSRSDPEGSRDRGAWWWPASSPTSACARPCMTRSSSATPWSCSRLRRRNRTARAGIVALRHRDLLRHGLRLQPGDRGAASGRARLANRELAA